MTDEIGKNRFSIFALGAVALLAGCASTQPPPPAAWGRLVYHPSPGLDAMYVSSAWGGKTYRKVIIDPVVVSLEKRWRIRRDTTPVGAALRPADVEGYKETLADAVRGIFVQELEAAGYRAVTEADPDTLRISPGLANVYMNTPPGTMDSWPAYQGRMTLVMEFRDGSDGRLLVRVVDRETGALGLLQAPNTVINSTDFQATVHAWARAVSRMLDTTNSQPIATARAAGITITR